jgi:hypothetical protein
VPTYELQVIHTTSHIIAHVATGNTDARLGRPARMLVARLRSCSAPNAAAASYVRLQLLFLNTTLCD